MYTLQMNELSIICYLNFMLFSNKKAFFIFNVVHYLKFNLNLMAVFLEQLLKGGGKELRGSTGKNKAKYQICCFKLHTAAQNLQNCTLNIAF